MRSIPWQGGLAIALAVLAGPTRAEEGAEQSSPSLSVELNTLTQLEGACRLTFYAGNTLGSDIDALSLEAVIFTTEGEVERLTLFDLGTLPEGRPRVRQFDLPGLPCDEVGQVLVNGLAACEGEGLRPEPALTRWS